MVVTVLSAAELAVGDQPHAPAEFPWVQVRHLASQVLGPLTRRGRRDWPARWGYAPLGLETCVAPDRFAETCYPGHGAKVNEVVMLSACAAIQSA
jgi:hypothetical protein